jgi:hypothetical protein
VGSREFFEVMNPDELGGLDGVNKRVLRVITTLEVPEPGSGLGQ